MRRRNEGAIARYRKMFLEDLDVYFEPLTQLELYQRFSERLPASVGRNAAWISGCLVGLVLVLRATVVVSQPPEELIKATGYALSAAKSAQADLYAGDALARAQALMNEADALKKAQDDKFALFRNYKNIQAEFEAAKTAFEAAQTAALEGKAQKKAEAESKVQEATTTLDNAEAALKTAPKSKDTKADIEAFANDIWTHRQTLSEAQADLASEDYLNAINKADGVNQKAAEIAAQVQAAIDKVKGRR